MKTQLKIFSIILLISWSTNFSQVSYQISEIDSILNEAFELRWSNPYESILMCSKALEISKSQNYYSGIVKSYSFMGVAYENLSMYNEALDYYLMGLRIADSLKSDEDIGFAYNNLANYYIHLEKYDKAFEYLQKALTTASKINNPELTAYIFRNFSYYYLRIRKFDIALEYAKKSLELREKFNDEKGIITSLRDMLIIYYNTKDFTNTENTLNRLYSIIGNNPKHKLQLARIKRTEGEILRDKKKYDEARAVFDESLELFKSLKNLEGIIRVLKLKADLCFSIGKFKESYNTLLEHNAYVDSLNDIRSIQKISLIETQFKNKQLQNELALAAEEIKRSNTILISLFIGFIILGISVYFTQKANREKRKLIAKISEQNKTLEEDINHKQKLLSIIGHDIKNPLSSVYSISEFLVDNANSIEKDELNKYLVIVNIAFKNALNLLDNLLLWSMNKMGKLKYNITDINLKTIIDKAIELYDSNLKEKDLSVVVNIDNQLVKADENTLSAIIRNLINNAIKFSFDKGTIRIESEELNNFVKVKIIDNGKGLNEEEIKKILSDDEQTLKSESSTGLGLQIVKDFIKINKGELSIKSIPNQETEFSFTLPKVN